MLKNSNNEDCKHTHIFVCAYAHNWMYVNISMRIMSSASGRAFVNSSD